MFNLAIPPSALSIILPSESYLKGLYISKRSSTNGLPPVG